MQSDLLERPQELQRTYAIATPAARLRAVKQRLATAHAEMGSTRLVTVVSAVEALSRSLAVHVRRPPASTAEMRHRQYLHAGPVELVEEVLRLRGAAPGAAFRRRGVGAVRSGDGLPATGGARMRSPSAQTAHPFLIVSMRGRAARARRSSRTSRMRRKPSPEPGAHSLGISGLDQLRQQRQRFLPAQVARLGRDHVGDAFLHDVQLGAARTPSQSSRWSSSRRAGSGRRTDRCSDALVRAPARGTCRRSEWLWPVVKLVNDIR